MVSLVFSKIGKLVGEETPLAIENYKGAKGLSKDQKFLFFISHSLRHATMTVGKLQDILHNVDHDGTLTNEEVRRMKQKCVSLFFTCFKLAFVLNVSPDEFVKHMDELLKGELQKEFLND